MLLYNVHHGDAFDFLADLAPESVDLIVSSPPYFMGKEYDKSTSVDDFIADHLRLLPLLTAALRPGGSLCWQVGNHVKNGAVTPLDALVFSAFRSAQLVLRNRIVWTFGHGVHASKRFSGRHETIMWYTKGDDYYWNLDAVRVPQKYPGKRHYKGPKKGEFSGNPQGKNPSDVWEIPNVNHNHVEKTSHPCQFPVGLVQRLVRSMSPHGGLVADPFAGSASTGVAALSEGRRFLGCELKREYVDIANGRLAALAEGSLRWRDMSQPVYVPVAESSLTKLPAHFAKASEC